MNRGLQKKRFPMLQEEELIAKEKLSIIEKSKYRMPKYKISHSIATDDLAFHNIKITP